VESDVIDLETVSDEFLFAEAQVGIEMENFLRTTPGRYLLGRCRVVVGEFNSWVLKSATPGTDEFIKRHAEARGAQMAMRFISEAVSNGEQAQLALEERDHEDSFGDGPLA